jgi:hypothetical protein
VPSYAGTVRTWVKERHLEVFAYWGKHHDLRRDQAFIPDPALIQVCFKAVAKALDSWVTDDRIRQIRSFDQPRPPKIIVAVILARGLHGAAATDHLEARPPSDKNVTAWFISISTCSARLARRAKLLDRRSLIYSIRGA